MVFFFIPIIVSYTNATYSRLDNFKWGYDNINLVTNTALLVGIIINVIILLVNLKDPEGSRRWTIIPLVIIVLLISILYFGNSISNFGF